MTVLTGGDAIVEVLKANGVKHVFGIVSVHNIPIYDAILRRGGIETINVRHEQGALHAADGYARATGRLGVAITSTGPGATNGMTGLFEAGFASSPVLMITGQTETGHYGKGKGVLHEAENQLAMLRTVTRMAASPRRVEDVPVALQAVIADIQSGRPQPGAIEIPVNLQYESADFEPFVPVRPSRGQVHAADIDRAIKLIGESRKRVIIAGGGVVRARAGEALTRFAESLNAPVFTSTNGRGAVAEDHPLAMGPGLMASREAIAGADLVIAIGTRFQGGATGNFSWSMPGALLHIDADPHMLGLNYAPDLGICADAADALNVLMAGINAEPGDQAFLHEVSESAGASRQAIRKRMGSDHEVIMDTMRELLPRQGCIVRDATVPAYVWGNTLIPAYTEGASIHSTSAAIGPGLPLAIGAAIGSGEHSVVIQGDGGFMLNIAELATAAQHQVPVTVCVFNDGGYGVLRRIQAGRFDGRQTGVDLGSPDFVAIAEGMGVKGIAVSGVAAFRDAFAAAMATDGPVLLDIDMDQLAPMAFM